MREDIVDVNHISDANESSAFGSDELLMENAFTSMKHPAKEDNDMEEEWSMIPKYVLKSLVNIQSLLFGSNKLVKQTLPSFRLTEDRLSSFMDSYALGVKDSNALVISKMVKPLTVVQEKDGSLLMELPEHPALEKVIETTKTLLEFPLSTAVSKALLGLQL